MQQGNLSAIFFLLHISIEEKNNSSRIQKNILKDIDRKVELQRYDKKMKTSWVFFLLTYLSKRELDDFIFPCDYQMKWVSCRHFLYLRSWELKKIYIDEGG